MAGADDLRLAIEQVIERREVESVLVDALDAAEDSLEGTLDLLHRLGEDGQRAKRDLTTKREHRDIEEGAGRRRAMVSDPHPNAGQVATDE